MSSKAPVAILRTSPETVLQDYDRLLRLAKVQEHLAPATPTILKDNISWHFPMPGANTTPWQLEGTIMALRSLGYEDLRCVQNMTVVIDAFKGEDLNNYVPIFKHYGIPVLYNFKQDDMRWEPYAPKGKMLVLDQIFPNGIHIPNYFPGKNIVHLPTVKCHIYTTTTGAMKNAFGGLLHTHRHYTHTWIHETLVDLLTIQKEIHPGIFAVMDGTTAGNGPGPRTMVPVAKNVLLASSDACANQAVRFRGNVYGLQFHLESSKESIAKLIENCRDDMIEGKFVQSEMEISFRQDLIGPTTHHMALLLNEIECRIKLTITDMDVARRG